MPYKCDKCGKKFETKEGAKKHEKSCKGKKDKKKVIKEVKCKCNSCGHVWHYLPGEEKRAKSGACWSAYGQMSCCFPMQLYSKQEGLKWQDKLDKFKKCPRYGSVNITKKEIEHETD